MFAALVGFANFPSALQAQVSSSFTPETAFPISLASPGSALSASVNPSSLGTLPSWSLSYSYVEPANGTSYRDRYQGGWFATPLGKALTIGSGIEFVRAHDGSRADQNGFVLASSVNFGPCLSLGTAWHMRSPRDGASNLNAADLSLSVRPSPRFALSVIARDLTPGTPRLGDRELRESVALAAAVRPVGDDRMVLEVAGKADTEGDLGLRFIAQTVVRKLGRLAVAGERSERNGQALWTLSAGLDVRFGAVSLAPGVHGGEQGDEVGWSMLADVHGQPRIGLPEPGYVAKVALRGLGPRRLLSVVRTLELALHDPRVDGVVLLPDGASPGLATAQEVRLLVSALEQAGKPVYCYLESASGSEYYLCAGARRVAIDPAGLIRLMGVGGDALFFGELLRNVGLRADFVRIGRYKSAPEQYTNDGSSEATQEVRKSLLDGAYRRLLSDLSADLGRDESWLKALLDRGPFLAQQAVQEKLVAATVDRHDLERDARAVFGAHAVLREPQPTAQEPRFGPTGQIGVVVVDGTIVDGNNVDVPFIDVHMSGGHTVADAIDRLTDDPRIRAIVLRIDSPGGAVMASDQIWRAARRARAKKPVIASMGEVAASGGYYVAAGASEIWASPSTITGSIGIFYGKVDVAQLAKRIGVGIETASRGAHAGSESLFRPFTDEERAGLADMMRVWYRQFLERVAEGRNLTVERVDELARGRVYSGDEAQALGLVDSLGGFQAALARARQLAKLDVTAELVVVPEVPSNLLEYVTGTAQARAAGQAEASRLGSAIPAPLRALLQRLYPWTVLSSTAPMALYEGPLRLE